MRGEIRQRLSKNNSVKRSIFVGVALLLQLIYLLFLIRRAGRHFPYASIALELVAVAAAIGIFGQNRSSASKMTWIVLMLVFPLPGLSLYLLVGQPWASYSMRRRFENIDRTLAEKLPQDREILEKLRRENPVMAGQASYLIRCGRYPIYQNTRVEYHAQGEIAFEALKEALRGAQKFIFMEYHAIELSDCFMQIEDILAERARAGVEVRLFYDDVGSLTFIGPKFVARMAERGIQCRVFNPLIPMFRAAMNNRDHRKISVIDGRIGFTGGYNLADEYFNVKHPYGHWKDTGVVLRGDAVRSLTVMFLEMWNAAKRSDAGYGAYLPPREEVESDGYVQPYADSPLDDERVGECVYLNLIKSAQRRVWIATPYLILDEELAGEMTLAAKRGVDVRIITPGIPDKRLVYRLTRSYYAQLIGGGVRIYEYAPGFIHAKQLLADDDSAAIGTINFDYRSLYLHFEDGVLLHGCGCISDMRRDFENTFALCREVTDKYRGRRMGLGQRLLRLAAPLL